MIFSLFLFLPILAVLLRPVGGVALTLSGFLPVCVLPSRLADFEWSDRRGVEGRDEERVGGSGGRESESVAGRGRVAEEEKWSEEDEEARGKEEEDITEERGRVETDRVVKEGGREEERDGTRDESEAEKEGSDGGRWLTFPFPSSTPGKKRTGNTLMTSSALLLVCN